MAYSERKPTLQYIVKLERNIYMILKNIKEKVKTVLSFGLTSISGRALFNIMLPNGACYWRFGLIPLFFQKSYDRADVPNTQTNELELWNCFSYWPGCYLL